MGATHKDPRSATLYEKDDRGEQRYTHRTPRPSGAAFWTHRSPRHRHPERDADQYDQHHQQDDDGDLQHVDDRTTRLARTPSGDHAADGAFWPLLSDQAPLVA